MIESEKVNLQATLAAMIVKTFAIYEAPPRDLMARTHPDLNPLIKGVGTGDLQ